MRALVTNLYSHNWDATKSAFSSIKRLKLLAVDPSAAAAGFVRYGTAL
jgi:hypothetical protein